MEDGNGQDGFSRRSIRVFILEDSLEFGPEGLSVRDCLVTTTGKEYVHKIALCEGSEEGDVYSIRVNSAYDKTGTKIGESIHRIQRKLGVVRRHGCVEKLELNVNQLFGEVHYSESLRNARGIDFGELTERHDSLFREYSEFIYECELMPVYSTAQSS